MNGSAPEAGFDLEIDGVSKRYGEVVALQRVSFAMKQGEILALLGPSGCGKSTLLNMIAGFEAIDDGTIRLRGVALNDIPPHRRDVAMVFQSYALFPHMTVTDNITYGLRARRMERGAVASRVREVCSLLKLDGLLGRYPAQLSGGQRQRVALARALAIRPQMLLLDEAFSALDRNLREEMQVELSLLLHDLHVTTILVTHDQREAFALADRIAIMDAGRIGQIGTPRELYERPANDHVLRFLGTTNRLSAEVGVEAGTHFLQLAEGIRFPSTEPLPEPAPNGLVVLYLRTENIDLSVTPTAIHRAAPATVKLVTFLGAQERIFVSLQGQDMLVERSIRTGTQPVVAGQQVFLDFDPSQCRISGDDLS